MDVFDKLHRIYHLYTLFIIDQQSLILYRLYGVVVLYLCHCHQLVQTNEVLN